MKTLLRFILFVFVFVCSAKVYSIDYLRYNRYKTFVLNYESVDENNQPILLSERVAYPIALLNDDPNPPKFIVLNCHGTTTLNSEVPTGSRPMDAIDDYAPYGAMTLMCSEQALVVMPDYLGYGVSLGHTHPYCHHMLSARNCIDGVLAAIDKIKSMGISIDSNYYTYNIGYSQGGAVAMAVQRYLETIATDEVKNKFKLKKTIAGAGPYNLTYLLDEMMAQTELVYPVALPLVFEALGAAYYEGCMRQVLLKNVYTTAKLRTFITAKLLAMSESTGQIGRDIKNYLGVSKLTAKNIFRASTFNEGNPNGMAIKKALAKNNLLDGKWVPQTPMILFHYTKDELVPYGGTQQAVQLFGNKVTCYTDNELDSQLSYIMKQIMGDRLDANDHSGYGIKFYTYFLDGILR